jgi:hypothetical protein
MIVVSNKFKRNFLKFYFFCTGMGLFLVLSALLLIITHRLDLIHSTFLVE